MMTPIFNNGHGGMINGIYQTPGKRSPEWDLGVLYEGMFNRWFINRLIERFDRCGYKYYHACPELTDVPLWQRVARANKIYQKDKNVYYFSLHANAGGGVGIEGFTSPGLTKSDPVAEMFLANLEKDFKGTQIMRFDITDGDRDKEAKFKELLDTHCPAFLLECGFMDHREDYKKLWSEDYLNKMVDSVFTTMEYLYTN